MEYESWNLLSLKCYSQVTNDERYVGVEIGVWRWFLRLGIKKRYAFWL